MTPRITLGGGSSPVSQIHDQISGLIGSGQLAPGEPLPSVRQLAKDLAVAPGTVAKAYRSLEQEGLLTTRIGGGTRVSEDAGSTSAAVLQSAQALARTATDEGLSIEEATRILRAVWPDRDPRSGPDRSRYEPPEIRPPSRARNPGSGP
ncbi:GntR family transcriptional regulator [Brachybacterium phenoliresistens]|uniref:GntR family transcriptional regulator n=1 Tax=Brachybacterium phenoliresistens TaxID=396014 RepID=UPI0031E23FDB